jgi:hypothetical protein
MWYLRKGSFWKARNYTDFDRAFHLLTLPEGRLFFLEISDLQFNFCRCRENGKAPLPGAG